MLLLKPPEALVATVSHWPRDQIEAAIEQLIGMLDDADVGITDLEPEPDRGVRDGLPGDAEDAE